MYFLSFFSSAIQNIFKLNNYISQSAITYSQSILLIFCCVVYMKFKFVSNSFVISILMEKRRQRDIPHQLQSFKDTSINTSTHLWITSKSNILNGSSNQQYHRRKRILQGILSIVLIVQILLFHCYFELDLKANTSSYNFLRAGQLCGAIGSIIILIIFHERRLYQSYTGQQLEKVSKVIIKLLIFLIMPYEFFNNFSIEFSYAVESSQKFSYKEFQQKVNYLLVIFSCFRLSYFIMSVLIKTRYMSPSSIRISKLYGFTSGLKYCLKSIFKDNPFSFIITIFLISFSMFSFAFRIAQNVYYKQQFTPLSIYGNMAWMTVVTMTTVGYGDYTPKTEMGRVIGALCVSWGVLIVSVMVGVLTRAFSMDQNEIQALNILRKLQTNSELRQYAGQFMRQSLWRFWQNYKINKGFASQKSQMKPLKDTMKERKLMLRFRQFRRLVNASKITEQHADFSNEMERQFKRAFINLENLTANNRMIIDYLHEQYIFKQNQDGQMVDDDKKQMLQAKKISKMENPSGTSKCITNLRG